MDFTERLKRQLTSDNRTKDVTISNVEERYEWEKAACTT